MKLSSLKYELIRTPLERPLRRMLRMFRSVHRLPHPELAEVYREDHHIDDIRDRVLDDRAASVVDVGAHYGTFLSHVCRLAPRGRHLAFEPTPEKARFLRRRFPEVTVYQAAASDT